MSAAVEAPSIRAIRLSKWYGRITALQEVTLHLEPGIWGLLGPNGSGKTTFMRLCAGAYLPSLGEVRVCGEKPFGNVNVLRRIGLCPEADAMYDELTGLEFVSALAELSGMKRAEAKERAAAALASFELTSAQDRKIGGYSRGMRQRAKLAQAMVHDPDVLLLDEPLTGTDPTARAVILDVIRKRAEAGALVLFSTHVLHEVESLTERVLLIARGQVVAQGAVSEIRNVIDEHPHTIRISCSDTRTLAAALLRVDGIVGLNFEGDHVLHVDCRNPDAAYPAIVAALLANSIRVDAITSPDADLEALFHMLVERSARMAGTGSDAAVGRHA